jgi:hypothetical protein
VRAFAGAELAVYYALVLLVAAPGLGVLAGVRRPVAPAPRRLEGSP